MSISQKTRLLKVLIITTLIIIFFEVLFDIPAINAFFNNLITNSNNWYLLIVWIIMFLQCTILNIPAYVVLSASVDIGINTLSFSFIGVVLSAYMCGCLLSYFIGYKFGAKAVKWCAGSQEDYDKWSNTLNTKGKWWYFITVIFPLFPDDILCIVAGSVKFDFKFYVIMNLIGRGIGLVCMIIFLQYVTFGGGFNWMLVLWCVLLIVEIVMYIRYKRMKQ